MTPLEQLARKHPGVGAAPGFGALDLTPEQKRTASDAIIGGTGFFSGLVIGGIVGVGATLLLAYLADREKEEDEKYRRAGYSGR